MTARASRDEEFLATTCTLPSLRAHIWATKPPTWTIGIDAIGVTKEPCGCQWHKVTQCTPQLPTEPSSRKPNSIWKKRKLVTSEDPSLAVGHKTGRKEGEQTWAQHLAKKTSHSVYNPAVGLTETTVCCFRMQERKSTAHVWNHLPQFTCKPSF